MNLRLNIAMVVTLLLSACGQPTCLTPESYQTAEEFPPLKAPPGLTVPPPDPNIAIPEVRDGPVAYTEDPDANNRFGVRCLDVPPRLPPSEKL